MAEPPGMFSWGNSAMARSENSQPTAGTWAWFWQASPTGSRPAWLSAAVGSTRHPSATRRLPVMRRMRMRRMATRTHPHRNESCRICRWRHTALPRRNRTTCPEFISPLPTTRQERGPCHTGTEWMATGRWSFARLKKAPSPAAWWRRTETYSSPCSARARWSR